MTYAKKLYLIAADAIVILSAGSASAQSKGPGEGVYRSTAPSDPAQEAQRKSVDDTYKKLMERIPIAKNHTTLGETFVRKRRHLRSSEMS
jgi:hypothetical protein